MRYFIILIITLFREEEAYPGSLSYSYSYDSVNKDDVHPEYETDNEEELVANLVSDIPLNTTVESGDDKESGDEEQPGESDDDMETVSSLSEEENADETIALLTEAVSNGSTSILAKTMIGVGIGCAAIVALLAFRKRQRRFSDEMSA